MSAYPTTDSASATIEAQNTFTNAVVMDYEGLDVSVSGTFVAVVTVQRSFDNGATWLDVETISSPIERHGKACIGAWYRAGVKTGDFTSGSVVVRIGR